MFYDRFVYLCSQKGISPSRAAVEAGISKSLVTKWRTNKVQYPSPDVARKLAKYFGISVAMLLGEETKNAPTRKDERDVVDEVDIAFYDEYKELDDEQKATIRDMVAVMRSRKGKRS